MKTTTRNPETDEKRRLESLSPIILAHGDAFARELFRSAAADMGLRIPLVEIDRGRDLLDRLAGNGETTPAPGVVLLDVLLPDIDALSVLRAIRKDPNLRDLPVLALGLWSGDREAQSLREAGATGLLVQPARFDGLVAILRLAEVHWCRYVLRAGGRS